MISVVWFYVDGRKTKKQANVEAKFLIGQGEPKQTFLQEPVTDKWKLDVNSLPRNTKKSTKYTETIYVCSLREICQRVPQLPSKLLVILRTIFQPWTLSSDILAAERVSFTKQRRQNPQNIFFFVKFTLLKKSAGKKKMRYFDSKSNLNYSATFIESFQSKAFCVGKELL